MVIITSELKHICLLADIINYSPFRPDIYFTNIYLFYSLAISLMNFSENPREMFVYMRYLYEYPCGRVDLILYLFVYGNALSFGSLFLCDYKEAFEYVSLILRYFDVQSLLIEAFLL